MRILLCFLLCVMGFSYQSISQINYNFFVSNSGKNTNPGTTKQLPKQTIEGTADALKKFSSVNGIGSIGLKGGNIFNETLQPSYPIRIGTYNDSLNKNNFAILNGSDVFDSGWKKADGTKNTFYQPVSYFGFKGNGINTIGEYSFIYVIEIDKELEKKAPYTARKLLRFASDLSAVDSIPGSFYAPPTTTANPIMISIYTSDGSSPNFNSKFRYEITIRDRAVNAYNLKNSVFENLWVRGYGAGNGSLPGGDNSYYNKIIFGPGAAIHHVSIINGTINNSLFLPGPKNTNEYAVVFYDFEGLLRHNKISNSLFLDIRTPLYTHTHGTATNYGALELDNVLAFADSNEGGHFVNTSNTDTISLSNVYIDGYTSGYNQATAKYASIKNSIFKDISNGILFSSKPVTAIVDNVFMKLKVKSNETGIKMRPNTFLNITNSIIHLASVYTTPNNRVPNFIFGSGGNSNHISAAGNIFISDVESYKDVFAASTNMNNGIAGSNDKWSNNVYILLRGNKILWSVTNSIANAGRTIVESFAEWQRQSGQDQNSLFFDLRNDPRGLQAIFIDPDKGNYELANTVEGNKIRALKAGMKTPITCFLKRPTYEEAAEMVMNGKIPAINSCKYKCQQTKVNLKSSGRIYPDGILNICEDQALTFRGSGKYEQNDISYHQSDATQRYLWWFSDGTDTSGINLNTITHSFKKDGEANIRLQLVDVNGCSYDSVFKGKYQPLPKVKLSNDTTICSGTDLTLSVNYPGADYLWNTSDRNNSITVKNKGTYWVQSTINGCSYRDSMVLKLVNCPCNVQMPNSFSPNGDGINDVYRPVFGCLPLSFELSVFNRYGQLVFKTRDYKAYWNGLNNGRSLPADTYVYVVNYRNADLKKDQQILGSITLLR